MRGFHALGTAAAARALWLCVLAAAFGGVHAAPATASQGVWAGQGRLKVAAIASADADWERRLTTREPSQILDLTTASVIKRGQKIAFVTLMTGLATDSLGQGAMECSVKLTRPDGKVVLDHLEEHCVSKRSLNPNRVFHSSLAVKFVGDENDPLGVWVFESAAKDLVSGEVVTSVARVKLVP